MIFTTLAISTNNNNVQESDVEKMYDNNKWQIEL